MGLCCGHEPDSVEFSTLGGWISTRASGMKKNRYGNIEDIVQSIKFVTSIGTYSDLNPWPRISSGPNFKQIILGHEGNLGVVTEAVIKIKSLPQVKRFGSVLFPDFENGIKFMEEVAISGVKPASLRLMDNIQFLFGLALKPDEHGVVKSVVDAIKKFYVLKIKGFDPDKMTAATLVFEGTAEEVDLQEK